MPFDPSKFDELDLSLTEAELNAVRNLTEVIETMPDDEFDDLIARMEEVVTAQNRRQALIDNALLIAKISILVLGVI